MRVIGVLDLAGGRAVHARGGDRTRYAPVTVPGTGTPGDAPELARWYAGPLGLGELYAADLDALAGGAPQRDLVRRLAAIGVPLLVDAAVGSPADAERALGDGAARVIVALESLPSFGALGSIVRAVGAGRACFGLDLRGGVPIVRRAAPPVGTPLEAMARAGDEGVRTAVVIDVARVGGGGGSGVALLRAIRERWPELEIIAGGGVRDAGDLASLAAAGVDGALVATALLEGRMGRAEIAAAAAPPRGVP